MYVRVVSVLTLTLFSLIACAQDGCRLRLRGHVFSKQDNFPVPFAELELKPTNRRLLSDANGYFRFDSLCSGSYQLLVHSYGHQEKVVSVDLNRNREVDIYIEESVIDLPELTIAGKVHYGERVRHSEHVDSLDRLSSTGLAFADYLDEINGVSILRTGPNVMKPVINGLHSQRVLIVRNGLRQEGQQWGSEHAPEVDPLLSGDIELIAGADGVRYAADAVGGVIVVRPRPQPSDTGMNTEIAASGNSNGRAYSVSALVEHLPRGASGFAYTAGISYRRSGTHRTPDLWLQNTAIEELNWNIRPALKKEKWNAEISVGEFSSSAGIFSGSHIGNLSDLNDILEEGLILTNDVFSYSLAAPRQEVKHREAVLSVEYRPKQSHTLSVQAGWQQNLREEYDVQARGSSSEPDLDLDLVTWSARALYSAPLVSDWNYEAGAELMQQTNLYSGQRFFIPNYRAAMVSAFALLSRRWSTFSVEGGVRAETINRQVYRNDNGAVLQSDFRYPALALNGSVSFRPTHEHEFRVQAALSRRPPSMNELYSDGIHHGTATYEIGDSSLTAEKAVSLSAYWTWQKAAFNLQAGTFVNRFDNFIRLYPLAEPELTISGAYPAFRYAAADEWIYGASFDWTFNLSARWLLSGSVNAVFAAKGKDNLYLDQLPAPQIITGLSYTLPVSEHFTGSRIAVSNRTVLKQNRYNRQLDYTDSPSAYTLFDVDLRTTWYHGSRSFTIGLGIENAFNVSYRDYLNQFRYYTVEDGISVRIYTHIPLGLIGSHTKNHQH